MKLSISNGPPNIDNLNPQYSQNKYASFDCSKASLVDNGNRLRNAKTNFQSLRKKVLTMEAFVVAGHPEIEKLKVWIHATQKLAKEREQYIDKVSKCLFKAQLNESIQKNIENIPNSENLGFLLKLQSFESCNNLKSLGTSENQSFYNDLFDSIFSFFRSKKELTDQDCEVLKSTYQVWSSFYELQNQEKIPSYTEAIPLYNVNPHNSAFPYWLKERALGNIPKSGLPLLHVDTHTDLGHIHSHGNGWSQNINLSELAELTMIKDNADFESKLRSYLKNGKHVEAEVENIISRGPEQLKEEIYEHMRSQVHHIAQPLIAGVTTDVASSLVMALPPWSERLPRSEIDPNTQRAIPFKVDLFEENASFVLKSNDESLRSHSSRVIGFKQNNKGLVKSFDLTVVNANLEQREVIENTQNPNLSSSIISTREQTSQDSFQKHFPAGTSKFILDIDLDAFVSEGKKGSKVEPVSYGRHEKQYGEHSGHDENTESDTNIEVPLKEFELIEGRINFFFEQLKDMKASGMTPAMITIADSTTLQRAIAGQIDDSQTGGNFTPSCLVFLVNFMVKEKLKALYPINSGH